MEPDRTIMLTLAPWQNWQAITMIDGCIDGKPTQTNYINKRSKWISNNNRRNIGGTFE